LFEGDWEKAYEKYQEASLIYLKAFQENDDPQTSNILKQLSEKYLDKAKEIKEYLNSTQSIFLSLNESSESYTSMIQSQFMDDEILDLMNQNDLEPKVEKKIGNESFHIENKNFDIGEILWKGLEKLLNILPPIPYTSQNSNERGNKIYDSFMLIPNDNSDMKKITIPTIEESLKEKIKKHGNRT